MPITASTAQIAALPTRDGGPQVALTSYPLSSVATTHAAVDISSTNLISISVTKFGVPVSETLTLQISIDGGANFRDFKVYSFAQINVTNGALFTEQVKGTHARLLLSNGQASIGFNCRFFI